MTREPTRRAAIALGANLGDRRATLEHALAQLAAEFGPVLACSGWLETEAVIHPDDDAAWHPAFLNGVALVSTDLGPRAIVDRLQAIERALGRDRSTEARAWQPRVIDLDLIALADVVADDEGVVVPHPRMHERRFVLAPMAEVWPGWRHPELGRTTAELLARLEG
jgi:2-amino-4-hydroxy-6-hydroxymethyldihydropteridine diphosphokinase